MESMPPRRVGDEPATVLLAGVSGFRSAANAERAGRRYRVGMIMPCQRQPPRESWVKTTRQL